MAVTIMCLSYNVEQAATVKGCSRRTIYNMIEDGRLETVNTYVGRRVTAESLRTANLLYGGRQTRTRRVR